MGPTNSHTCYLAVLLSYGIFRCWPHTLAKLASIIRLLKFELIKYFVAFAYIIHSIEFDGIELWSRVIHLITHSRLLSPTPGEIHLVCQCSDSHLRARLTHLCSNYLSVSLSLSFSLSHFTFIALISRTHPQCIYVCKHMLKAYEWFTHSFRTHSSTTTTAEAAETLEFVVSAHVWTARLFTYYLQFFSGLTDIWPPMNT